MNYMVKLDLLVNHCKLIRVESRFLRFAVESSRGREGEPRRTSSVAFAKRLTELPVETSGRATRFEKPRPALSARMHEASPSIVRSWPNLDQTLLDHRAYQVRDIGFHATTVPRQLTQPHRTLFDDIVEETELRQREGGIGYDGCHAFLQGIRSFLERVQERDRTLHMGVVRPLSPSCSQRPRGVPLRGRSRSVCLV